MIHLTIFYTDVCNVKCRHCFIRESTGFIMNDHDMEMIIDQCIPAGISAIHFTGGEVTLFWDKLKHHVAKLSKLGIESSIFTNGWWASDDEHAEFMIKDMSSCGVTTIICSLDQYHSESIPQENIFRICRLCKSYRMGFNANCAVGSSYDDCIPISIAVSNGFSRIQNIADFGNAKINHIGNRKPKDKFVNVVCPEAGNLAIAGDSVMFCCGPTINLRDKSPTCIGNIHEHDISFYIDKISTSTTIQCLRTQGPFLLYERCNKRERNTYCSLCDLCIEALSGRNDSFQSDAKARM